MFTYHLPVGRRLSKWMPTFGARADLHRYRATLPGGKVEPLVWIKDWDFNWQSSYHYRKPLFLPKGTKVELVSYFDNSSENPNNPHHPPKPVGWGEKTTDEMCIAFVDYLKAEEWQPDHERSD